MKAAADVRGHTAGQTLWVRVLAADPVYEPQLSQRLFKAAFVACPAVNTIMVSETGGIPLEDTTYGCPLVYKSGWIRALEAGLAPTINTRGGTGWPGGAPSGAGCSAVARAWAAWPLYTVPASPCLSAHRSTGTLSIYQTALINEWAPVPLAPKYRSRVSSGHTHVSMTALDRGVAKAQSRWALMSAFG